MRRSGRYALSDSPLYRVGSRKKLFAVLQTDRVSFRETLSCEPLYKDWTDKTGREVSSPAKGLKLLQKRIADLLCRIEIPPYLKSAIKGESYVTNAEAHATGSRVVKTDISKFYPNIPEQRIFDLFYRRFQCSHDVSITLARLLSRAGALATGSPASTIVSYLCNKDMFDGMAHVAAKAGNVMTVYVDDVTFSGRCATPRFLRKIKAIASAHGYRTHKNRAFRKDQPKKITGVVVKGREILLPNERHKRIHERLRSLKEAGYSDDVLYGKVLGSLNEAMQVEHRQFGSKLKELQRRRLSRGLPVVPPSSTRRSSRRRSGARSARRSS